MPAGIITVTPNPALDVTVAMPALRQGEVIRAKGTRLDPGGKGINVARALHLHGVNATAVYLAGGRTGRELGELLDHAGISGQEVPITGAVRTNYTLTEADGTTTKINEPGPGVTEADCQRMLDTVAELAPAAWIAGCGSLPAGAPADLYGELVAVAKRSGAKVVIDSSGSALAAAVAAGAELTSPNLAELEELTADTFDSLGAVVDAAGHLLDAGVGSVLVSLGAAGAVLVRPDAIWHAHPEVPVAVVSTAGAGDSLLAGYLWAQTQDADCPSSLHTAVAWGTAAVGLPGSQLPDPAQVAAVPVRVTDSLDRAAPVKT